MTLPPTLQAQWEDGDFLGTCDWGHCNREQAGWAKGDPAHPLTVSDDPEWLAICAPCARGEFATGNDDPVPVIEHVPFPAVPE